MISSAFFTELEKIAADQKQQPGEGPGGPFVTKDRLKRLGRLLSSMRPEGLLFAAGRFNWPGRF